MYAVESEMKTLNENFLEMSYDIDLPVHVVEIQNNKGTNHD